MASTPSIPEYFADKSVFITGATGFLGKVLVEKLLRSCPNIKSIYCLVRPKNNETGEDRMRKIMDGKLYDKLRSKQPDFQDKVHVVHGDVAEEDLGLLESDKELLHENVNVVFHSAATVRFDEELRLACQINILGVRRVIQLCRGLKHLEVLLHVSTAYANCDQHHIEERIYPTPVEPQKVLNAVEWMDAEMLDMVHQKLIAGKPNTYTYTKHLAEILLSEEASDLPVAIVRPSIVTAVWKEPLPGWIDNMNGPSGLYIAAGKGIMRSLKADSNVVADLIPVDLPTNMMIAAAWRTAVKKPDNLTVYHMTSGGLNPFTWGEMENIVMDYFKRNPMESCFRRPKMKITSNSYMHDYWLFWSHLVPAYMADFAFRMAGKKPRMVSIYSKLHKAMGTLEYFTLRSWDWTHSNMDILKSDLQPADQKAFYFDPRSLHWQTYIQNYCEGTKTFILKEDLSGLPAARAHLRRLRNIRYTFNTILVVVFWRLLIARSHLARNSWFFVLGLMLKFVRFFRITSTISR